MKRARKSFAVLLLVALGACSSQKPAPVVDRSGAPGSVRPPAVAERPATATREARDGIYTVQRGDTLYSIAMAFGVDVRDLARWNGLADASVLRVGQALRITPPPEAAVATVTPITPGASTEVRPLPAPGGPIVATPPPPSTTATAPSGPTAPDSAPAAKPDASPTPTPSMQWLWPTAGKVIDGFDAPRNKGIDIGGNEGEPVLAAADGEVVHVGSALRGYGNLVIIRHPGDYVTAYGHNRKTLVSQGQQVRRGQQIAELGRTDSDRPKLHFEIRHQGKPLDPVKYLPPR
jgi:lipoprotein NlpD